MLYSARRLRARRRTGGCSSSLCLFSQAARSMPRPHLTGNGCWWEAVNELCCGFFLLCLSMQLLLSLLNCNYLHLCLLTFSPSQVKRGASKLLGRGFAVGCDQPTTVLGAQHCAQNKDCFNLRALQLLAGSCTGHGASLLQCMLQYSAC